MTLEKRIYTMPEAFFDALKANANSTAELKGMFDLILESFVRYSENEPSSEFAFETAARVLLGECGYTEANDSVKDFLGLDEEEHYYSI